MKKHNNKIIESNQLLKHPLNPVFSFVLENHAIQISLHSYLSVFPKYMVNLIFPTILNFTLPILIFS